MHTPHLAPEARIAFKIFPDSLNAGGHFWFDVNVSSNNNEAGDLVRMGERVKHGYVAPIAVPDENHPEGNAAIMIFGAPLICKGCYIRWKVFRLLVDR